jgi:cell division protein FtsL
MKTRNEQSPSFIRRAVDRRGLVQFASATCACAMLGGAALFHAHVRTRVTEEGYRLSRLSAEQKLLLRERDRLTLQTAQLLRPARIEELARRAGMGPPSSDRVVVVASAREYGAPRRAPVATAVALREGAPRAAAP